MRDAAVVAHRPGGTGRWVFFGLAALSILMFSIDGTIVAVALPTMMRELDTSLVLTGWTLTAYALAQTVVMPLAGKLSEQFGRMRVFLVCVVLFTGGSLLCGIAPNIYALIVFRIVQALGGGGFMPSAVGIVAREFPDRRGQMIGLFASIFPIGGIIGPNLGGYIVEHFSWRDIFLVNVPIGLVVMALMLRMTERPEPIARRSIDVVGSALFTAMIVALLLALTLLGSDPSFVSSPLFVGLLATSGAALAAFIWQEQRAKEPVLDLALVTRHPFPAINVYNFLFGACVFGFFSFVPYFAEVQYGMSPSEAGAVLTPRSIMMIVTSAFASLFLIRFGYRLPMILGLLSVTATLFLLSLGWASLSVGGVTVGAFWLLATQMLLAGVGMELSIPASNNAALDLMPDRAAVITGIRGTFRSTGGVIGTALIVLTLEFYPDKAEGLRAVFLVLPLLLLLAVPLVLLIPDSARDRRRSRSTEIGGPTATRSTGVEATPRA